MSMIYPRTGETIVSDLQSTQRAISAVTRAIFSAEPSRRRDHLVRRRAQLMAELVSLEDEYAGIDAGDTCGEQLDDQHTEDL